MLSPTPPRPLPNIEDYPDVVYRLVGYVQNSARRARHSAHGPARRHHGTGASHLISSGRQQQLESANAGGYRRELLTGRVPGYYTSRQGRSRGTARASYTPKRSRNHLAVFGCRSRVTGGLGCAPSRDKHDDRCRRKRVAHSSHTPRDIHRITPVPSAAVRIRPTSSLPRPT